MNALVEGHDCAISKRILVPSMFVLIKMSAASVCLGETVWMTACGLKLSKMD